MISDNDIERAVDFLRDNAGEAARLKAHRVYCDEYRKSLKALLMKEHAGESGIVQEREAYADKRYQEHLIQIRNAVFEDENNRALRQAAEIKIAAWQSMSANNRGIRL
jgi:hypothetical protein